KNVAAIGHGKQEGFAKIESGVPADNQPKIASTFEGEGEHQRDADHAQGADPGLAGVLQVHAAKTQRENRGRGPKSDAVGQRELQIAAKRELLKKPHQDEEQRPGESPAQGGRAGDRDRAEAVATEGSNKAHQNRDLNDAERGAMPKSQSEPRP